MQKYAGLKWLAAITVLSLVTMRFLDKEYLSLCRFKAECDLISITLKRIDGVGRLVFWGLEYAHLSLI